MPVTIDALLAANGGFFSRDFEVFKVRSVLKHISVEGMSIAIVVDGEEVSISLCMGDFVQPRLESCRGAQHADGTNAPDTATCKPIL